MPSHAAQHTWGGPIFRSTLLALVLSACAPSYSPDTYSSGAVQQASKVEQGVIVGGIAASQAPVGGVGSALSTLGGTLVGGLVGTGIERATGDTTAFEYIVSKPNGNRITCAPRR